MKSASLIKSSKYTCSVLLDFQIICALALNEELLDYVSDDVPGGSYKYYSLTYDGYIKIRLTSL